MQRKKHKWFIVFPAMLLAITSYAQQSSADGFSIHCPEPAVNLEELASDTFHTARPFRYFIEYRNKEDKIVCFQLHENPVARDPNLPFNLDGTDKRTNSYYYANDTLVYESIVLPGNKTIRCFSYKYNLKKQLIYREGFSSEEPGVKIYYEYDNAGKLRKETQHRADGVTTKEYRD